MRDAERRRRVVARLRHRAERGKIAVDEAGIDRAAPEFVGAAKVARKATLLRTPAISVRSSARASRSSAASRVGACAMSLAIIAS